MSQIFSDSHFHSILQKSKTFFDITTAADEIRTMNQIHMVNQIRTVNEIRMVNQVRMVNQICINDP